MTVARYIQYKRDRCLCNRISGDNSYKVDVCNRHLFVEKTVETGGFTTKYLNGSQYSATNWDRGLQQAGCGNLYIGRVNAGIGWNRRENRC